MLTKAQRQAEVNKTWRAKNQEHIKTYRLEYYSKNREKILAKRRAQARGYCLENKEKIKAGVKEWRRQHKEKIQKSTDLWVAKKLLENPDHFAGISREYRQKYPHRTRRCAITYRQKRKLRVFKLLGNCCRCCGEKEVSFLQIDHVYGDGHAERRLPGFRAGGLHIRILKNEVDLSRYQLLCANCHSHKSFSKGPCPHQRPNFSCQTLNPALLKIA